MCEVLRETSRDLESHDSRADNQPEAAWTIVSRGAGYSVPGDRVRPSMKVPGRRAANQPGAARTSVALPKSLAVPGAESCVAGNLLSAPTERRPRAPPIGMRAVSVMGADDVSHMMDCS